VGRHPAATAAGWGTPVRVQSVCGGVCMGEGRAQQGTGQQADKRQGGRWRGWGVRGRAAGLRGAYTPPQARLVPPEHVLCHFYLWQPASLNAAVPCKGTPYPCTSSHNPPAPPLLHYTPPTPTCAYRRSAGLRGACSAGMARAAAAAAAAAALCAAAALRCCAASCACWAAASALRRSSMALAASRTCCTGVD
jgi:hypothetical protein